MEEQQLIAIEEELRAILVSVGLQWILESVDDAIASGLSIEKGIAIRQRRRWTRSGYENEEVAEIVEPGSRERPQRIVATDEPFNRQQRVSFLLSALRRAIGELPVLQEETFKSLHETDEPDATVRSIRFLPDENSALSGPPALSDLQEPRAIELRAGALRLLEVLAQEVNR
jgi:hypothetical protein